MANQDWLEEAGRRYKEKSAGARFKLTEGENSIRILPRKNKDGSWGGAPYLEYFVHQKVGPNERFLTCGKDVRGQGECWLCDEMLPKLKVSQKKPHRLRAAAMAPAERFTVQIFYLDDKNRFAGPVAWSVSTGGKKALATQILGLLFRSAKKDICSLSKGYNINIERTGTGFKDTRYGAILVDDSPTAIPKELVAKIKPLEELMEPYDGDKQQAAFYNREVGSGGDDDTDLPPEENPGAGYDNVNDDRGFDADAPPLDDDNTYPDEVHPPDGGDGDLDSMLTDTSSELDGLFDDEPTPQPQRQPQRQPTRGGKRK